MCLSHLISLGSISWKVTVCVRDSLSAGGKPSASDVAGAPCEAAAEAAAAAEEEEEEVAAAAVERASAE